MINKFISYTFIATSLLFTNINAEITETAQIESILPAVENDSFVLFNVANVLTDSELSLGSPPWRAYVKARTSNNLHDKLTWLVLNHIPHKSVEFATSELIKSLQNDEIAVAGLTSRGRSEWYSTQKPGVDKLTNYLLNCMGIDFRNSTLPFVSIQMEGAPFLEHFNAGIFYSNHMEKGQFIKELLANSGYKPASVVLVDDKLDSLVDVEAAMQELNIPFHGYWYTRAKENRKNFSPMVANVQLQSLLLENTIISDEEAQKIIDERYSNVDPDEFFQDLMAQIYWHCE